MKDFEIVTDKGTYFVAELNTPNGTGTYDIMMVFKDGDDLIMVDYLYGVTMMSEEEIENNALEIIKKYENKEG